MPQLRGEIDSSWYPRAHLPQRREGTQHARFVGGWTARRPRAADLLL
jgi:hypothetical protein